MEHDESPDRVSKLIATGSRLAIDGGTVEVSRGFENAGVKFLLLKGPSIGRWLYAEGEPRTYVDCDLLVAPTDVVAAEEVLASLGYAPEFDDRKMPSWWREHASEWIRQRDGLTVDLHRTLQGVGVDSDGGLAGALGGDGGCLGRRVFCAIAYASRSGTCMSRCTRRNTDQAGRGRRSIWSGRSL